MKLSVVIPAYNEEKKISGAVQTISSYLSSQADEYEIIVVNDGSTDGTADVVSNIENPRLKVLHNEQNRGKGYAVKQGVLAAQYPLILFSDADQAVSIEELEKLTPYIEQKANVVIASRNKIGAVALTTKPKYRQMLGKTLPFLVRWFALEGFFDTQCGFKLFRTDVAKKIFALQTIDRFSFDVEILCIARILGYRIEEVPVVSNDLGESKVRVFRDSLDMFLSLFRIRKNAMMGKYSTVGGPLGSPFSSDADKPLNAEVSIVIPAYNEEERICPTLETIISFLQKTAEKYEIIVVDDCSTDKTAQVVAHYEKKHVKIVRNKENRGKGYSVKQGILQAQYPFVLFTDADLSMPIEHLSAYIAHAKQDCDIVVASRNLKESRGRLRVPAYRIVMGKIFSKFVRVFLMEGILDTQCGFKLFKTEPAKKIVALQTLERFAFDVEILFIARTMGYKIKEAPITWEDKPGSSVSVLRDSLSMFMDVLKIKSNARRGKYKQK